MISLIRTVTTGLEQKPAYPVAFKEEGWPIIAYVINATDDDDDDDSLCTLAGVSAAKQLLEPIGRGKCCMMLFRPPMTATVWSARRDTQQLQYVLPPNFLPLLRFSISLIFCLSFVPP